MSVSADNKDKTDRTGQQGFVFSSNRASRLFALALEPLGGKVWQEQQSPAEIDLLYFDDYGGKQAPAINSNCFSLIPRQRTVALDNKADMARALIAAGLDEPRVYFASRAIAAEPDSLWYVKLPYASGGRGIRILSSQELIETELENVVIQEAIRDVLLIEQRKFTLRLYVLVNRGKLYLFDEGFAVLHAVDYDPDSRDPEVQFAHEGYMDPASGLRLLVASHLPQWKSILQNSAATLTRVFEVFRDRLRHEQDRHFCLFGVDLLVREDYSVVLVEINDRPNLVHTDRINKSVNIPMLAAMAGILNPDWRSAQEAPGDSQFRMLAAL
jgi:prolyl 4-hydroxylase